MMRKSGLLRRRHSSDILEEGSFIDLGATEDPGEAFAGTKASVRMAEILRYDDVHAAAKWTYQGDIVILDITSISNDSVAVRRMSLDLKNITKDTGGDVAGIAKNLLCLTPAGIRIDRQKLRSQI